MAARLPGTPWLPPRIALLRKSPLSGEAGALADSSTSPLKRPRRIGACSTTATQSHVRLPETWLVLVISVLAVIAIALAVSGWQRWAAAAPRCAPAQMHAVPAPSPGGMAAAFARVVAI